MIFYICCSKLEYKTFRFGLGLYSENDFRKLKFIFQISEQVKGNVSLMVKIVELMHFYQLLCLFLESVFFQQDYVRKTHPCGVSGTAQQLLLSFSVLFYRLCLERCCMRLEILNPFFLRTSTVQKSTNFFAQAVHICCVAGAF